MRRLGKVAVAASGALFMGATLSGPAGAVAHRADSDNRAIECDSASSGEAAEFYDGESASYTYDEKFANGPAIPNLPDYTPQGLALWEDWDGSGNDLLLTTSYLDGAQSRIAGVDPSSGETVGSVAVAESHVGGVAVVNGWAFVQGDGDAVRKYDLSQLAEGLQAGGTPELDEVGSPQEVYGASFLTGYGNTLYAGKFNALGRDKMVAYEVAADGTLTEGQSYEVPTKSQGLMVTPDNFVYSTSYGRDNRSNVYVVDHGATDIDQPSTFCFRAPSMSEGVAAHQDTAYLLFESGASQYSDARNVIKNLHTANIPELVQP